MSNDEIVKGSIVYTLDGHECEVVALVPPGAVVKLSLVDETDYLLGQRDPCYIPKFFTTPPAIRLAKEYEGWQQSIEDAKKEFKAIRASIEAESKVRTELLDKLKQIPALKHIEAFIDGKITHYVITSRHHATVSILTFAETVSDEDSSYEWRKDNVHKAFHYVVVNWLQEQGFK